MPFFFVRSERGAGGGNGKGGRGGGPNGRKRGGGKSGDGGGGAAGEGEDGCEEQGSGVKQLLHSVLDCVVVFSSGSQ